MHTSTSLKRNTFCLCFGLLLVFLPVSGTSDETDDFITILGVDIPVQQHPEMLVTGIDVDTIVNRHIPDLSSFQKSISGPSGCGLLFRWRVPRPSYRNVEEMHRVWSSKGDPRFMRLDIGIYPDPRKALIAAKRHFDTIAAVPRVVELSREDPGYVSWTIEREEVPRWFVRDNVFVCLQIAEELNPAAFLRAFDEDLKNGADGIFKGDRVEPPIIHAADFPSSLALDKGKKVSVPLDAGDFHGRRLYRSAWIAEPVQTSTPRFRLPNVRALWTESGQLEIKCDEKGQIMVAVHAVAVNDLCVVSEVWSKQILISVRTPSSSQ